MAQLLNMTQLHAATVTQKQESPYYGLEQLVKKTLQYPNGEVKQKNEIRQIIKKLFFDKKNDNELISELDIPSTIEKINKLDKLTDTEKTINKLDKLTDTEKITFDKFLTANDIKTNLQNKQDAVVVEKILSFYNFDILIQGTINNRESLTYLHLLFNGLKRIINEREKLTIGNLQTKYDLVNSIISYEFKDFNYTNTVFKDAFRLSYNEDNKQLNFHFNNNQQNIVLSKLYSLQNHQDLFKRPFLTFVLSYLLNLKEKRKETFRKIFSFADTNINNNQFIKTTKEEIQKQKEEDQKYFQSENGKNLIDHLDNLSKATYDIQQNKAKLEEKKENFPALVTTFLESFSSFLEYLKTQQNKMQYLMYYNDDFKNFISEFVNFLNEGYGDIYLTLAVFNNMFEKNYNFLEAKKQHIESKPIYGGDLSEKEELDDSDDSDIIDTKKQQYNNKQTNSFNVENKIKQRKKSSKTVSGSNDDNTTTVNNETISVTPSIINRNQQTPKSSNINQSSLPQDKKLQSKTTLTAFTIGAPAAAVGFGFMTKNNNKKETTTPKNSTTTQTNSTTTQTNSTTTNNTNNPPQTS